MARARNLKPGFFKNEDLAECSPWARLCFAGLWTLADRAGRLEDRPKRIKGELFAYDSVEVEPLLQELARYRFILRYEVDGQRFIQVSKFEEHQTPHYTEKESLIPGPEDQERRPHDGGPTPGASREHSRSQGGMKRGALPPDSLIHRFTDSLIRIPATSVEVAPALPSEDRPPELPALTLEPPPTQLAPPSCPHLAVLALWAEVLPAMPQHLPAQWRGTRADHLRARWRETAAEKGWQTEEQGLAYLRKLFAYVGQSPFLTGRVRPREGKRPFFAELEWLVNPTNWAKVHEGKYHTEAS